MVLRRLIFSLVLAAVHVSVAVAGKGEIRFVETDNGARHRFAELVRRPTAESTVQPLQAPLDR
jgi:hypothetical protein